MTLPDYVSDYQERAWQTYFVPFGEEEAELTAEPSDLSVCNSDSQMAAELKDASQRFYVDCELLAAGLDPGAGVQVGRLLSEWRGHETGTLVICSYERIRDGQFVYAVEI